MKTKAILSSLLVCIVTTLSAQINLNDSTVQVVAYWSKGDSYDYRLYRKQLYATSRL